ncbi:uncharacterized protein LOC114326906 isoform X2 [Diabrotica virgifera virgifera]|nr:uncharacterized protein LOC114326906 isoform X2 [Diabrotica virgifera virgifera]
MSTKNLTSSPYFDGNSHIEALGISSARSSVQPKKKPNLSRDIIDVTEYSNDGIKLINREEDMVCESRQGQTDFNQGQLLSVGDAYESDSSLNKSSEIPVSSVMSSAREPHSQWATPDFIGSCDNQGHFSPRKSSSPKPTRSTPPRNKSKSATAKPSSSPKPRLIRSNSYTLESPSPILLAHLQKCCKTNLEVPEASGNLSRGWTSLENNFSLNSEDSEFSSLNTVYNANLSSQTVSDKVPLDGVGDKELRLQKDTGQKSPTIEVVQTDISVQHITVNANSENIEPVKGTLDLTNPDCQLMQVLKKIPEDYSKQIIELLEKRRQEHQDKVENFGKQFKEASSKDEDLDDTDSITSELSSWSNYCAVADKLTEIELQKMYPAENRASSTIISNKKFFENETYSGDSSDSGAYQVIESTHMEKEIGVLDNTFDVDSKRIEQKRPESMKKVFLPNKSIETANKDAAKRRWAACIICAYVKGYLTRRLLHTSRVQSKIDTIRDAVICALQLHEVEHFDEADAELHRRLINQVSAACYEIHDIFFNLPMSEKMAIIATDRKRLLEKARRPSSAPEIPRSLSNSSRSSTKSFHSQTLMKT